jgi:hypothetical protein
MEQRTIGLDGNTATKFRKALSPPSAEQSKDFHTVLAYDPTHAYLDWC